MDIPEGYTMISWDSEFKDSNGDAFKVVACVRTKDLYNLHDLWDLDEDELDELEKLADESLRRDEDV